MKNKNYYEIYSIYRAKCLAHDLSSTVRQRQKLEEQIFNKFVQGNIDDGINNWMGQFEHK